MIQAPEAKIFLEEPVATKRLYNVLDKCLFVRVFRYFLIIFAVNSCSFFDALFNGVTAPPERVASSLTRSADGGTTALAVVEFHKGFHNFHSGVNDKVVHLLKIERGGKTHQVEIMRLSDDLGTPKNRFRAAVKATMQVAFATDGHSVSATEDGGKTFHHVILDTETPFACGRDEKSTHATSRDLVLSSVRKNGFPTYEHSRVCNLEAVTRFICSRSDDEELWTVVAEAFVQSNLTDEDRYPLLACLSVQAGYSKNLRSRLKQALRAGGEKTQVAAEALSKSNDPQTQLALAAALAPFIALKTNNHEECWTRAKLAWALSAITSNRHAAPQPAHAMLVTLTKKPDACPDELAGKATQIYGLVGLVALHDPTVKRLAATCKDKVDAWTLKFKEWNEAMVPGLIYLPLNCLAKGAILGDKL